MSSAQYRGIVNPSDLGNDDVRADFQSLLHAIHALNISSLSSLHARGKLLLAEGEPARGIYILRSGRASVSISSSEGKVVTLRLAQPGDVLGWNCILRNSSYNITVKAVEQCRTDFIARAQLMEVMEKSLPGAQAIMRMLSRELAEFTDRARLLLLPQTAKARLARLLLEWCDGSDGDNSDPVSIDKLLTQEEIAQMICSSRETVTRALASLSRRRVIRVTADSILIRDRTTLETMARA